MLQPVDATIKDFAYTYNEDDVDDEEDSNTHLYIECDLGDSESVHEEDDFDMDPDDEQVVEDTVEEVIEEVMEDVREVQQDDETDEGLSTNQSIERVECSTGTNVDDVVKPKWRGYKIVGDNIDKNFRRSFQRVDYQTRSFHYFHSYGVIDRVDFSGLSDAQVTGEISLMSILPSKDDIKALKEAFYIFVSRYNYYNAACIIRMFMIYRCT